MGRENRLSDSELSLTECFLIMKEVKIHFQFKSLNKKLIY